MRPTVCLLALLSLGCRRPDPAPTELDELLHFFMAQVDQQDHERIIEGTENLVAWYEASEEAAAGEPFGGTVSDLTQAEVDALAELKWDPDPALATGVFAVSELSCDLDAAAAIALEPDQMALFPDNYSAYERSYDTDSQCYLDDRCDAVDWTSEIEDAFLGSYGEMSYRVVVKLRRSRDEETVPRAMLVRSIMPEAAEEEVSWGGFEQGYHIEIYVPHGQGILHAYGMWSYGWASFMDEEDDPLAGQYVAGLLDFEADLERLCTEGW